MNSAAIAVGLLLAVFTLTATGSTNDAEEQNTKILSQTEERSEQATKPKEPTESQQSEESADKPTENDKPETVKVKPNDTLEKIAKAHDTTLARVFNANDSIKRPDLISVGDELVIPDKEAELPDRYSKVMAELEAKRAEAQKRRELTQRKAQQKAAARREQQAAQQQREQQSQTQQQAPTPQPSGANTSTWDRLAECESNGNWSINTGNGYYGGLQFSLSSWRAVGGNGYPHQASKSEQIARAEKLKASQGWGAWPACSAKLGLL